ncbi:MAG: glycosyltransferase family 2 protein, partial [Actinomycetes bacterium]
MSVAVGVVVVFEGDLATLALTIDSIRNQTVKPQELCVAVNSASNEIDAWLQTQKIKKVENFDSVSGAVNQAISNFDSWANDAEHFVWLLNKDTVADSTSLAELLRAAERSPSVAVVAPKLVDGHSPRYLHEVGLTLTPWGGLFSPATEQLDQAQFDTDADVLAVSGNAALVRSDVWQELNGFDSNFIAPAQAIDFSIRARLKGFRVEVAPLAKASYFGRRKVLASQKRTAELQLKAAYMPVWLLPFFWVSLPLWGLFRGFYQVANKNLELVSVELSAAAVTFLRPWQLISRHRRVNRPALAQTRTLRASWAEVLAQRREVSA